LTQAGVIAGTPLYMSPEQARGEALDYRSDLFSLGSVLYTLCAGLPAFPASSALATMKRVCEHTPRPIREINPDIPDWLAAIVGKLLAKNPADRFQSAAELAELLGQHLAHLQQSGVASPPPLDVPQLKPGGPLAGKRHRFVVAALLVIAAGLMGVAFFSRGWLFPKRQEHPDTSTSSPKNDPPQPDPRVLTVSKEPKGGGRFRTISAALDRVKPGMIIRVLDDSVYEEYLLINRPEQYRDVVLEATGKATIRRLPQWKQCLWIRGVGGFTLRGLCFESVPGRHAQVNISGSCPGVTLDRLDMKANPDGDCVALKNVRLAGNDAPIVVQNCTMREGKYGVYVDGIERGNITPCGHVVIRNNTVVRCGQGVRLSGVVYRVQVVGNRVVDAYHGAIDLIDLIPDTADLLVANNTLFRNQTSLRIYDDSTKGKDFLNCKNIRVQYNLVLAPVLEGDLWFLDHRRGIFRQSSSGDLPALLNSPAWRLSHNWREIIPLKANHPKIGQWIPRCPNDQLQVRINVQSRKRADANFLRPPKDSPLARAGLGDGTLPAYVGAVPPEGVEPWDWDRTWRALAR
jgi:hypothetical protein